MKRLRSACACIVPLIIAGFILLIQIIPYGRKQTNSPVINEPAWDSPRTRQLAQRACFDCHSNETIWPGYARIAPISWLVQNDVEEGRDTLNFSAWEDRFATGEAVRELQEVITEGEMPPAYYSLTHPAARLTPEERSDLIDGLTNTLSSNQTP